MLRSATPTCILAATANVGFSERLFPSRGLGRASRGARPRSRPFRPSTQPRRPAARASPRNASRGRRGSPAGARRRQAPRAAWRRPGASPAVPQRARSPLRCRATPPPRRASAVPDRPARRRRALRDRDPRERVQLECRAPLRRALDDPHARASVDFLELEHHLAVVIPVEHESLLRLRLADDRPPLVPVAPAEDSFAARLGVELDLGREPLLEPLRLGQRLPHLGGRRRKDDLALDLHGFSSRLTRNLVVAYKMRNR